ncbi:FAD/NAD-binding domain-containing protein [Sanghuangporus baumii]|uniref:FAD/NAD-binding domain-containing protein n=1 Tax=Sanghuangporus baumii TaxID=108892 RepID=A0A9Q5I2Z9_SANBA|nr:FAD/NAD-binding domain-containing protein [Sanghuangporus baumii]
MDMQNVIVLGGSYAGARAAHLLGQGLGSRFRVIMIDRNSHANHLYVFPRFAVLPGHEHKAFVPYKRIFNPPSASSADLPPPPHVVLHAKLIGFSQHDVTIDRTFPELGFHSPVIPFRYAVYALGNRLPAPIDLWSPEESAIAAQREVGKAEDADVTVEPAQNEYGGTKQEAMVWLKRCQDRIRAADSILCIGGGALGIQFATDIKSLYPEKQITLLHSRHRLLPRFEYDLHCEVLKTLEDLRIDLILGERLDLSSTLPEAAKFNESGQRVVRTEKGREVAANILLLCTGQIPNTDLLAEMSPQSVDPKSKLAYVLPTMQLGIIPPAPDLDTSSTSVRDSSLPSELDLNQLRLQEKSPSNTLESEYTSEIPAQAIDEEGELEILPETPFPHIFAVGDCADAFGAIKAGHTAYWQAEVAARNIIRLARTEAESEDVFAPESGDANSEASQEPKEPESLELESYTPGLPAIKVSLGIGRTAAYQFNGMVGRKDTPESDDLDAPLVWSFFGMQDVKPEEMYD